MHINISHHIITLTNPSHSEH